MRTHTRQPGVSRRETGFSLIELLIVVVLILIVSAVALPGILSNLRNYKVRGGAEQVASAIQTARTRAVMRNVNRGVVFQIFDRNTYRFVIEDPPVTAESEGPLLDLPTGVFFVATGATASAMRFDRMGRWCDPGTGTAQCTPNPVAATCTLATRCGDSPGSYIVSDTSGALITLTDYSEVFVWQVGVVPGGRVRVKRPVGGDPGK